MIYKNELCSLIVEYFCNLLNYLIPSRLIMYTSILVPHKENKTNLPQVKGTSEFSTGARSSKDHREIYRIWRTWGETNIRQAISAILICLWLFGNKPKLLNMLLFEAFLLEYVDLSWGGKLIYKFSWSIPDFLQSRHHCVFRIFKVLSQRLLALWGDCRSVYVSQLHTSVFREMIL